MYAASGGKYSYTIPTKQLQLKFGTTILGSTNVYADSALTVDLKPSLSKTLTFKKNGTQFAALTGVLMDANKEVNIAVDQDYNLIPTSGTPGITYSSPRYTIKPTKNFHVYRIDRNANFDITIDLGNYSSSQEIISFEVHVRNTSSSSTITWNNLTCLGITKFTKLTDLTTVEPGKTNVWVFRCDKRSGCLNCSYGLAYIHG